MGKSIGGIGRWNGLRYCRGSCGKQLCNRVVRRPPDGGTSADFIRDVNTDTFHNCYVTGTFGSDTLIVGDTVLLKSGQRGNVFMIKLDGDGNTGWAKSFAGAGRSIVTDAAGNCYATGNFEDYTTIGSITLNSNGFDDFFVIKTGNAPLHIEDRMDKRTSVLLYPNPVTQGELTVELSRKGSLSVYNTIGKLVFQRQYIEGKQVIPLGLVPGIYVARIETAAGVAAEKIIVQ